MILVGSSGKDSGKTVFACELVKRFRVEGRLLGAKVTTIHEREGGCPRGGDGCGACELADGDEFCLAEEEESGGEKDTQRLLASGADQVFWLRAKHTALEAGARALLDKLGRDSLVVCESNSLRTVVAPGLFFMVQRRETARAKQSARNVLQYADRLVYSDGEKFDFDFADLRFENGGWALRDAGATADRRLGEGGEPSPG